MLGEYPYQLIQLTECNYHITQVSECHTRQNGLDTPLNAMSTQHLSIDSH